MPLPCQRQTRNSGASLALTAIRSDVRFGSMTYTKTEIFQKVSDILENQFDVDPAAISMDARLREDLDIDSIDAVNLIIELKSFTVKKLALDSFREVRTIGDVIDAVYLVVEQQSDT